jgi:hypothetical protein
MLTDWHPQDWITIAEALSIYDQWRDSDDETAEPIVELQRQTAVKQGYERASLFRGQIRM